MRRADGCGGPLHAGTGPGISASLASRRRRRRLRAGWRERAKVLAGPAPRAAAPAPTTTAGDSVPAGPGAGLSAGQDTAAQLAWFEAALAASKADWKIVIGHHPV